MFGILTSLFSSPLLLIRRQVPVCRFPHRDLTDLFGMHNAWYVLLSAPGIQMTAKSEMVRFNYSGTETEHLEWNQHNMHPPKVHASMFTELVWTLQQDDARICHLSFRPDRYNITFGCDGNYTQVSPIAKHLRNGINFYGEPSGLRVGAHGWEFNASYFFVPNAEGRKARADISIQPLTYQSHLDDVQFGRASTTCAPLGIFGETWDGGNTAFYHRHIHTHENMTHAHWHSHEAASGSEVASGDDVLDDHDHGDHDHNHGLPSVFSIPWDQLSVAQRTAALGLGYDEYTWPAHSHGRRLHEHEGEDAVYDDDPNYPGHTDLRNYTNNGDIIQVTGEAELALTMPLLNYVVSDPYNITEWTYSRFFKSPFASCLPRLGVARPHIDFYHRHALQHTLPWSVGIY